MGPTMGPVARTAQRFENRLGYSQRQTPIISNWMPGLGDGSFLDTAGSILEGAQQKADELEMAIKTILALSAVAAVTGVINLVRK